MATKVDFLGQGTITRRLGPVGKNGVKACPICGMTDLEWVSVKMADGTLKNRIVPKGTDDLSGKVHARIYGECQERTKMAALNGASGGETIVTKETVYVDSNVDLADATTKIAELTTRVDTLDAFTTKLDTQQAELAPAIKGVADHLKTTMADLRAEVQKFSAARELVVKAPLTPKGVNLGRVHNQMANLITMVQAVRNTGMVYMVGEAGSFKSSAIPELAKALGMRYMAHTCGEEFSATDVFGFRDANGNPVDPFGFRDFYVNGGLTFLDEISNAGASGLTSINSLTSNHAANFATGMETKHADNIFIGADNTYGRGADAMYVARSQLDAATLSRFVYLPWQTDWDLLTDSLGLDPVGDKVPHFPAPGQPRAADDPEVKAWAQWVYRVYSAVQSTRGGVRVLVTSRAVINGQRLLMAGIDRSLVEWSTVWGHMPEDAMMTIKDIIANPRIEGEDGNA